jgi:hypothetical protein
MINPKGTRIQIKDINPVRLAITEEVIFKLQIKYQKST